ncbi:MAG TPA: aminotransferase class III-fold pyridoxal phosphate-dependent enzyme [Pseudomonas sp.]|uniref:aspartate aminotransferase family protein n=1 Tax=Pseudomonas sp. TaxID=306 RepID=UPI002B486F87|nr:aminotransferase class III-fold pyridoxal phosphate-dependent enzyme [Pseudomonas sp.]HKS13853.1 aminotransferase class III-fold pyridoxal phosphate-dependent enzyme [Pseudomonas sp.]
MNSFSPLPAATDAQRVREQYRDHVNAGYARLASMMNLPIEVSGAGVYLFDMDGNRYLDAGGYGVFLLGHSHPHVVEQVSRQLHSHPMASKLMLNPFQAQAAAALAAVCPGELQYVFFCNSGTEATEAALKLAWLNGCQQVISTAGGYHGKSLGALAVTGRELYRSPFADRLGHSHFVPFGDIDALRLQLESLSERACVILEPIQAEAGVIVPPADYLRQVRGLCDQYNAVLIADEIQSGMGRTGRWWACDHHAVTPDILLAGKSLSGGCVPVSAMVCTPQMQAPLNRHPLMHTSTFGANPLAMAAVMATLEVMQREHLVERAETLGQRLQQGLQDVLRQHPRGTQVQLRCAGLLLGLEFADAGLAANMVMHLIDQRIVVNHSLNDHRVIRLTPPALYSDSDIDWLLGGVARALASTFE